DERADSALPPASSHARRGAGRADRGGSRDRRDRRDDRADRCRDGGARGGVDRGTDRLRHGEGDRPGDGGRGGPTRREDEGAAVRPPPLTARPSATRSCGTYVLT